MHIPESIAEEMERDEGERRGEQEREMDVDKQGKRKRRKKRGKKWTDLPRISTGVINSTPLKSYGMIDPPAVITAETLAHSKGYHGILWHTAGSPSYAFEKGK